MQIAGRGRFVVWEGASLWVLAAGTSEAAAATHAHHAIQVTISLRGDFLLEGEGRQCRGPVAAVAADYPHRFEASGAVALLFVEPESAAGRAISVRVLDDASLTSLDAAPFRPAVASLRERFASGGANADFIAIGRELLQAIGADAPARPLDRRIKAMIDHVRANLEGVPSLSLAAGAASLSPSRARHLFAAETGLPFKAFVLWQRLERALESYAAGHSLTEAAHDAGFADSAHFSRTFRRTFGIPASHLELT